MAATKVLIVTDSVLLAQVLATALGQASTVRLIGAAATEESARELIRAHDPDVLVVDLESTRFDANAFITRLMRARPIPIVATFSLHDDGIDAAVRALESGAVDFVSKPDRDIRKHLAEVSRKIVERVLIASTARPRSPARIECVEALEIAESVVDPAPIAIGACTGGPDALRQFLTPLPATSPPILIVQHMPARFTTSLANRLSQGSPLRVVEAGHGMRLQRGVALLAPGNFHMRVAADADGYFVTLDRSPSVHHHRPAIDILFQSVAANCGARAVGVLLTGSGMDGALGLRAMREAGAHTLGQDQQSAVQYEMLRHAVLESAIEESLALAHLPRRALELACDAELLPNCGSPFAVPTESVASFASPLAFAQQAGVAVTVSGSRATRGGEPRTRNPRGRARRSSR